MRGDDKMEFQKGNNSIKMVQTWMNESRHGL